LSLKPEQDACGRFLLDHSEARPGRLVIERDDGFVDWEAADDKEPRAA